MSDLAAVCFDLDGTLCVGEQDPERLLAESFDAVGVEAPFTVADLGAVDTGALPTAESDREFYEAYFGAAARRADAGIDAETVSAVAGAYLERFEHAAVRAREGAIAAVEAASERYPVGLVTNGGAETQREKLAAIGLEDAFDAAVFCDPANGIDPKPDPTPLELALDALDVPAERTLLVGDTLGCDVAGAREVGMDSAWVPLTEPDADPDPEPTHVVESMSAVLDLF